MKTIALACCALSLVMAASDDVPTLISALSGLRDADRAQAAALLREKLAANPSLRVNDRGLEFWKKRFARVRPGMRHAQVLKLLPGDAQEDLIAGSGQTHLQSWRLDSYWKITVQYHNPDIVAERPTFTNEAKTIGVEPPKEYTGPWVTYYVNGQKHDERQYRNGKVDGLLIAYYDNGQKSYQQSNVEGVTTGPGTGWYRDGRKMYESQYANG